MRYKIIVVGAMAGLRSDFEKAGRELSELVNQAIGEGWRPLGGVAVGMAQPSLSPHLFQAMIHD